MHNQMRSTIALAACLLMISAGCKKTCSEDSNLLPDGNYAGSFRITELSDGPTPVISHVTLRLHDGKFEGNSDKGYQPAICHGSFTRNGNTITFNNECFFPQIAGLIPLEYSWDIAPAGDSVRLTQQNLIEQKPCLTLKRID